MRDKFWPSSGGNYLPYQSFSTSPPWGDCDLVEAKRVLQGRVCIVGNLDDMEVIDKLDEATVRAIARERLQQAGPDDFVLGGTSSGTYTERAARNFMAMVEVAEEFL